MRIQVGDLVRWMHPDEPAIGIVGKIGITTPQSFIYWSDGDLGWYDNEDLEVI